MAMSTANLHAVAIAAVEEAVGKTEARGYDLSLGNIMFIFGLDDDGSGVTKQGILLDAGRWFSSQSWVDDAIIDWVQQRVVLYNPMPSTA